MISVTAVFMPSLYVRLIGSTLPSDISMLAQFTMRFMRFRFTMQLLWHWAKLAGSFSR